MGGDGETFREFNTRRGTLGRGSGRRRRGLCRPSRREAVRIHAKTSSPPRYGAPRWAVPSSYAGMGKGPIRGCRRKGRRRTEEWGGYLWHPGATPLSSLDAVEEVENLSRHWDRRYYCFSQDEMQDILVRVLFFSASPILWKNEFWAKF
jgi:hypothetical protein